MKAVLVGLQCFNERARERAALIDLRRVLCAAIKIFCESLVARTCMAPLEKIPIFSAVDLVSIAQMVQNLKIGVDLCHIFKLLVPET